MSKVKERGGVRAIVTKEVRKVTDLVESEITSENVNQLKVSLGKIVSYQQRLAALDEQVFESFDVNDEAGLDDEMAKTLEYNDFVLETITVAKIKVSDFEDGQSVVQESPLSPILGANESGNSKNTTVKLPKLEIAEYDGNPLEWQTFWDRFSNSVDGQSGLSDIDKFNYLKKFLKGDAAKVADGYRLTAANYRVVIDVLTERFGNPQRAIFAHIEAMLAIPECSHEVDKLQATSDACEMHIRSLVALGLSESTFSTFFAPIMLSKLPKFVKIELHRKNGSQDWSLDNIRTWLKDEIRAREMGSHKFGDGHDKGDKTNQQSGPKHTKYSNGKSDKHKYTAAALVSSAQKSAVKCAYCSGSHYSDSCDKVQDVRARRSICEQQNMCFNCLAKGHSIKKCHKKGACVYCHKPGHHRSLCLSKFGSDGGQRTKSPFCPNLNAQATPFVPKPNDVTYTTIQKAAGSGKGVTFAQPLTATQSVAVAQTQCTVLETALANILNTEIGGTTSARLLFDTAGSRTFITEAKQKELGLRTIRSEWISVSAFQSKQRKTNRFPIVELAVICRDGSQQLITASVVPTITCPIQKLPLNLSACPDLASLPLAEPLVKDVEFVPIDILIGGDYYYDFMLTHRIRFPNGPILLESKLGYVTAGRVPAQFSGPETIAVMLVPGNGFGSPSGDISFDIQRYWELEDIGFHDKSATPTADEEAVAAFNSSVTFEDDRYHVRWPWKTEYPALDDNFPLAKGRLRSLVRRLQTDENLRQSYEKTFNDQIDRGIIEEAPRVPDSDMVYYMPHHPVIKPDRATTKVRIVFDASSKSNKNALSLNDCVHRGPVFLEDLCGLLMRVRLSKVLIISDIEKAFHMIGLQKSERDVTRFLWIRDYTKPLTDDNIVIFRFARVPFGVVSSSFLLGATIQHHLQQADSATAQQILRGLYVDNVITGADDVKGAMKFYGESKSLFSRASLNLREWYTNSESVRENLADADKGASTKPKILGLRWNVEADSLGCSVPILPNTQPVTKRSILGSISGVFDPCGFFSPITVMGKMLVQDLWKAGVGWDDTVSAEHQIRWEKISKELEVISVSDIPRFVGETKGKELQLHVFCDASQRAYSAVVYLRIGSEPAKVHLLFSRSRLAPVKGSLSIPRVELTAVCVGFRLIKFVESQLDKPIASKTIWTDSQCTLHWIKKEYVSTPFVETRLKPLRDATDIKFRYVGTKSNPADLPTRGCQAQQLMNESLWWKGPIWLREDLQTWPLDEPMVPCPGISVKGSDAAEDEVPVLVASSPTPAVIDIGKFSSLTQLLRTTAWVFRFSHNSRTLSPDRRTGVLKANELYEALVWWIKQVQLEHFSEFLDRCHKTWRCGIGQQLQIFQDNNGIFRCGGRIHNADLSYDAKHPILLPPNGTLSRLIVSDIHNRNYHSGVGHTLVALRQRYWIVKGRSFVRNVIRECKQCRRVQGGPFRIPEIPPLPISRTELVDPFDNVGIDHFGPLWVKEKDEKVKVWGCIFVCMVSRAIHIELVESLSAENFLLAFRRFCAAQTVPKMVMSDNSTTFKSADRALQLLWTQVVESDEVNNFMAVHGVKWSFVVEYASWMGGFYERLIGIVKQCLKRSLFATCLTKFELATVFAEIAQVVNCRPLVYVEDEADFQPLCPIDLIGARKRRVLPAVEPGDEYQPERPSTARTLISNWHRLQAVKENFWSTWQKQYLTSLREKQHTSKQRNCSNAAPKIGMVVLIKDQMPRNQWKLGKIEALHVSFDGNVRSVTLRLATGKKIDRPIKLLYPLEMSLEHELNKDKQNDDSAETSPSKVTRTVSKRAAALVANQRISAQLDEESD